MNNSDSVDSSPDGCVGEKRSVSEEELIDAVTQSPNLQTDTVIPSSGILCGTSSTVSIEEAQNMEMPISVEKNLEMDTKLGIAQTLEKLSVVDNQAVTCEDNLHGLSIASDSVSDHTLPPPLNSDNISVDETETKEVRGDRPNPFNFSVGQGTSKLHEKYKNLGNFLPLETFGNDELAGSFIQPNSFTGFSGNDSTFLNTDINSKYTTDGQVVDEKYLFSTSESRQTSTSSNTTSSNSDPWVKISPNETQQNNSPEISPKLCENDEAENDKTVDLNGMPKLDESLSSGVGLKKAPTIQNYVPLSPHVLDIPGPCEPEDLIEGIIFSANYLGTTQLASNKNSAKNARMFQAQEAVNRIKAPDGESQPTVEVDLFISTSKVKILNADTQETMMSHTLRSISYIADVGDLLVVMAKRHSSNEDRNGGEGVKEQPKRHKIICHVLSSSDSHLIAESIGQCFNVAYQQFLQSNCIEPENLTQADFNNLLDTQEMYHDDLVHYSKQENVKEIWVEKKKGEAMGVAIVESGWGSIIPTVILANLQHGSPMERNGKFSIGDQVMAINSTSMVGLPLQTCHSIIKGLRNQTLVKINIVSCPPVVSVLIKRPDLKHQLGFSVQNGIICSLMRGGIAERGGVRVGHRIIEISNQSVVATPHDKIVQMLVTSVGEIQMKTMPAAMYRLLTGQEQPIYL